VKPLHKVQEQRLHPLSWLVSVLGQWPQFLMLVVFLPLTMARKDSSVEVGLLVFIFVLGLFLAVLVPVLQYFTYHYRIEQDRLIIRSGIIARTRREIPFTRIHNVALHQNLLHRLFHVAELRLESAAGNEAEAHMRVLALEQALALERLIRGYSVTASAKTTPANIPISRNHQTTPVARTLLTLPLGEQIRLGVVSSHRAWIGLIALFGITQQFIPVKIISEYGAAWWSSNLDKGLSFIGVVAGLFLWVWIVMQAISVLLSIIHYHGFKLTEIDKRLTVERGLFTRRRSSVARRRIQSWTVYEGVLQRLLGRRQLQVDIASVAQINPQNQELIEAERNLAPLAPVPAIDRLLQHLLPHMHWPPQHWQPVAINQWWRLCLPVLPLLAVISALACWKWGTQGMWVWLWLAWSAFKARRQIVHMGWVLDGPHFIIRNGWWHRTWRLIELEKIQGLQLQRSPLDRCLGTATLYVDSAGAVGAPALQLRFVPYARAHRLLDHLTQETAKRKLQW